MRTTNLTGLPEPLVAALRDDGYSRGQADISATGLIAPPRKVALEEKHAAALEEDAADMAAILIGKSVHWYIWWATARRSWEGLLSAARAVCSGKISGLTDGLAALRLAIAALDAVFNNLSDNKRLFMRVNGWVVSGQTDHADTGEVVSARNGKISDFKTVSVNEWKYGLKEERAQQLNIYAELLRANGYTVTGLSAILIFKDWSATRQAYEKDYPPHSIMEVEVPLWPQEQAQAYILERVLLHQQAREYDVLCTDEERWLRVKHAVVKGANKRATRLFETAEEAEQFALTNPDYRVEVRGGEPTRCMYYCTVGRLGLCQQYEGEK